MKKVDAMFNGEKVEVVVELDEQEFEYFDKLDYNFNLEKTQEINFEEILEKTQEIGDIDGISD